MNFSGASPKHLPPTDFSTSLTYVSLSKFSTMLLWNRHRNAGKLAAVMFEMKMQKARTTFFFIFQKLHFHKKQVIRESGTMWRSESSSNLAKTRNNTADCSANGPFICSCDSVLLVLQLTSYCAAVRRAVMKYHSIAANSILP